MRCKQRHEEQGHNIFANNGFGSDFNNSIFVGVANNDWMALFSSCGAADFNRRQTTI